MNGRRLFLNNEIDWVSALVSQNKALAKMKFAFGEEF